MKLLDPDHPFFAKAWVRWLTVLVPGLWSAFELYTGNTGWAILFGALSAYAAWILFLKPRQG